MALGITKAGSAANTFGVSLEELLGHTTAITTATRESGSVIGNSLKTIYSRLTTMEKSEGVLESLGISMRDMNGDVRGAAELLTELAGKWNDLTSEQQQYAGVQLGSRWQLSRFLALMQNYSIAVSATETALNSQGSSMRENEKYMDSLAARVQKMKTAWETLSVALGNAVISDSIIAITTGLATLLNSVATVIDKFGALPVVLGVVAASLTLVSSRYRAFNVTLVTSTASLIKNATAAAATGTSFRGLAAALTVSKTAMRGFLASTGVGAILVAIGYAAEWLIGKFADASESTEELSTDLNKLNDQSASLKNLERLSATYEDLANKTDLTTEEKIKLANAEETLSAQHGIVLSNLSDQSLAFQENTDAINGKIAALKEEIAIEREKAQLEYQSNASTINAEIEERRKKTEEAAEAYRDASEKQKEFLANLSNGTSMSNEGGEWSRNLPWMVGLDPNNNEHANGIEALGEELATAVKDAKEKYDKENSDFVKQISVKEKAMAAAFQNYIDTQELQGKKIKESTRSFADIFAAVAARSNQGEIDSLENFEKVFSEIQKADVSNLEQAVKVFEKMPGLAKLNTDEYNSLSNALSNINFDGVSDGSDELSDITDAASLAEDAVLSLADAISLLSGDTNITSAEVDHFAKALSAAKDETTLLDTAQNELKTSNKLSAETIEKLNKQYGDFNTVVGLSSDELYKYITAKKDETNGFIQAEIDKTNNLIEETKKRIQAIDLERQKLIELYSAKVENGQIDDLTAERIIAGNTGGSTRLIQELDALKQRSGLLTTAQRELSETTESNQKSFKEAAESASKAEKKSQDTTKETTEVLTELQKKLNDVESALSKVKNEQNKYPQSSKKYLDAIAKENKLLEQKKKLLQEGIDDPSKLISTKTTYTTTSSSSNGSVVTAGSSKQVSGDYSDYINKYAAQEGIDPALVKAVAMQESTLGKASNNVMQVNGMSNSTPEESIKKGTQMLADLLKKTNGDINKALSAYNMGPGVLNYFNKNGGYSVENMQGFSNYQKNKHGYRIYGDPDYVNHVLRYYDNASTTASVSAPSSSSKSKTTVEVDKPSQKDLDTQRENAIQEQLEIDQQIYENRLKVIDGYTARYQAQLDEQDASLAKSTREQSKHNQTSEKWRSAESDQIEILTDKQAILHKEAESIRTLMSKWGIESDELTQRLAQLSEEWYALADEKSAKQFAIIVSELDEYANKISGLGSKLDFSNAKLSALNDGSEAYKKELSSQIPLLQEQQDLQHKEAELIRESLKNDKLSAERKAELSDRLQQLTIDWWNNEAAIKSTYKTLLSFTNEALSSLFDTLKTSLDSDDIFDLDEFNDSVDSIIAQLDMIDGKYENGVRFVDTTTQSRSDLASYASQIKDIAKDVKSALNYSSDMSNINFNNMTTLGNQIRSQINLVAQLKNQIADIDNQIRDTELAYQRQEAALEQQIKNTEKYYDTQIEKQQEILDNLDEQYEKEDRVKKLQELNDEISKVKNDKRFSYITEAGQEILTYDKGRVEELEKQKDELVEQYEREDVKQAIQDEIDRLQEAKDREVQVQQDALERTKQINQQSLEAMRLYQSHLSSLYSQTVTDTQAKMDQFEEALRKGLEDGTLSADEGSKLLQLVVDGWQASSLNKWDIYISQVASKLAQLQAMYANMASLAASMGSIGGGSSGSSSSSSSNSSASLNAAKEAAKNQTNSQAAKDYIDGLVGIKGDSISQDTIDAIEYNTNWRANRKYHTGGRVGDVPLKPNEYPTVLEVGEWVLTEDHINKVKQSLMEPWTLFKNLYSGVKDNYSKYKTATQQPIAAPNGPSYTIEHMEVKANNPMELFDGINTFIKSNEK